MPGSVSTTEARGAPTRPTDIDYAIVFAGYTSASPVASGKVSPRYSSMAALVSDFNIGDCVDMACHAVKVTDGNPAPIPVAVCPTPATTPGVRGATLDVSGVTGTAVITKTAATHPKGTWEPYVIVVDDGNDGNGGTIGTAGIVLRPSLDNGRTFLPDRALGTATQFEIQLTIDGVDVGTGVKYDIEPSSTDKTALYSKLNTFATTVAAHFTTTTGSPAVHASSDTTDNTALTAIASATTPATAVAKFNGILSILGTHGASATYHTAADATLATALAAISVAVDVEDVELHLNALISAYNAHRVNVTSVHGTADSTNTITAFTASPGTLKTGDYWSETVTTPPMWADSDLYSAGPPAAGAFAVIAESDQQFGIIVITEPVAASDFATLSAGLDYGKGLGKKWRLLVRFRDPNIGESDSAYITAFRTFAAANHDSRIGILVGNMRVTDAFRGYVYQRSGMGPFLARIQGNAAIPGQQGERLAQHPGYVARGPLEGASLTDANGNLIGHDETIRGGIDGPVNSAGGGITFYRIPNPNYSGVYVSEAPVLYSPGEEVLTWMDRSLANGIEMTAEAVAWQNIQGADTFGQPDANGNATLDDDVRDAMAAKIAQAIRARYATEFQNPNDINLVQIDSTVTVNGSQVTISGVLNVRLYGYTNAIRLTFSATR